MQLNNNIESYTRIPIERQGRTFLVKHRRLFIICGLVAVMVTIIFLFYYSNRETDNVISINPILKNFKREPLNTSGTNIYYVNRTSSLSNVNGYSWLDDNLIYSTEDGIFNAKSNERLYDGSIANIYWNSSGLAIFSNETDLYTFDSRTRQTRPINLPVANFKVSKDSSRAIGTSENDIYLYDLNSEQNTSKNLGFEIKAVDWTGDDRIIVQLNENNFILLDTNLDTVNEFSVETKEISFIDSNTSYLSLTSQNKLYIYRLDGQNVMSHSFQEGSIATAHWIDEQLLIVYENYKDRAGRTINNIWSFNVENNNFELMANSRPITKRLQTTIPIYANESMDMIPLIENKGQLWLLGLKSGMLPGYSSLGITMTPITTYEDEHQQ